ncbi:MAG: cytochrome c family protein [Clostridia bacterium]|nr:cytochrome c family protein [Deltaproteobacteria bacterium]
MVHRLEKEIEALDDGPAKDARRARLELLESSTIEARKPTGRYVSWSLDMIDESIAKAEWAAPLIASFNKSLCDLMIVATRSRTCEPPHAAADAYVGNAQCRSCHAKAFSVYNQTKHARAWSTLVQASKSCDVSCIGCHSVGYEKPGGYCRLDDVERFENVGCENCHGPGAGHIAHPDDRKQWAGTFRRGRDAETCMQCHNHDHSDQFDFETYLPRILGPGHGISVGD